MAKLDVNKKKVKLDILKITMFVADLINYFQLLFGEYGRPTLLIQKQKEL